jgi:hypothetical protein
MGHLWRSWPVSTEMACLRKNRRISREMARIVVDAPSPEKLAYLQGDGSASPEIRGLPGDGPSPGRCAVSTDLPYLYRDRPTSREISQIKGRWRDSRGMRCLWRNRAVSREIRRLLWRWRRAPEPCSLQRALSTSEDSWWKSRAAPRDRRSSRPGSPTRSPVCSRSSPGDWRGARRGRRAFRV